MQKVSYMGDGSTTEFSFNFPYFENSNIIVTKNNSTATGYSIIGTSAAPDADIPYTGGSVIFETAPTSLDSITISRSLPLTRIVDYQPTAKLEPTALNQDANYLMEVIKDLQDELDSLCTQYADIADKESTTTLLARISAIHDEIVAVSAQITALGDISTLRTNVTTNTNDITALKGYDYVIESQSPTAENNYTWYRKYKSGWVEQGGRSSDKTVTFTVTMADTDYLWTINVVYNDTYNPSFSELGALTSKNTTGFTKAGNAQSFVWSVCGMAA